MFHSNLEKYINGGCLSRRDIIWSVASSRIPFKKNAYLIQQGFRLLNIPNSNLPSKRLHIEVYKGKNPFVVNMMKYLQTYLKKDLIGAYVHGSLGTYEEVAFSDFDALAIIRNGVFSSSTRLADVAIKLNNARSIMFDFDPLQHHGWFVLTEKDLDCYRESYFPSGLFQYAKSLFFEKGTELEIHITDSAQACVNNFHKISNSIIKEIGERCYPQNMYSLKCFLSKFMLLPSLYVQIRDKRGIFKKYSFESAKKDFTKQDWSIMEDVSSLRGKWSYNIPHYKKRFISQPKMISRLLQKMFAPEIPSIIKEKLTYQFYQKIDRFVIIMKGKVESMDID